MHKDKVKNSNHAGDKELVIQKNILLRFVAFLEKQHIVWIGFFLLCLSFLPCLLMGKGVLFDCHDTYDGALLTYILSAKYIFQHPEVYPELMNGIPVSGMTVPAPLFVVLYVFFSPFTAHMLQYIILSVTAYWGMYFCTKEITGYKFISVLVALLFALLPFQPVYGHSVIGIPLAIYAFYCLYKRQKIVLSWISIAYFGFASSFVYVGYACICILAVICVVFLLKRKGNRAFYIGCGVLLSIYVITNLNLIYDTFFSNGFISHREEFILYNTPFWTTFKAVFLYSTELAVSCHQYMIVPILSLFAVQTIRFKKMVKKEKQLYQFVLGCLVSILFLCLLYSLYFVKPVVELRELLPASIRNFQFQRICFFLPVLWYFAAAASLAQIWEMQLLSVKVPLWNKVIPYAKVMVIVLFMAMTIITIRRESFYRWNLNQLQSPHIDFGVSYEEYFSENQFTEIKEYIGKPQDTYKVASLGLCPAVPLYNGFYCIDGYSNNYPLDYKYKFRQIIEEEINKNENIKYYYDTWGSRCYLYADQTYCIYEIGKKPDFSYENLELNTGIMKEMGCEYIFAAAPIENPEKINLVFQKEFKDEKANQDVYLYKIE